LSKILNADVDVAAKQTGDIVVFRVLLKMVECEPTIDFEREPSVARARDHRPSPRRVWPPKSQVRNVGALTQFRHDVASVGPTSVEHLFGLRGSHRQLPHNRQL
jgi:hypothetical protein